MYVYICICMIQIYGSNVTHIKKNVNSDMFEIFGAKVLESVGKAKFGMRRYGDPTVPVNVPWIHWGTGHWPRRAMVRWLNDLSIVLDNRIER